MRRHTCKGIVVAAALFASELALAASITVNTATDDFGSVTSNCSLREAIQSANGNANFGGCVATGIYNAAVTDVIILPTLGAGASFNLTRIGTDDSNNSGDLDINGSLRIEGAGGSNSLIRGNSGDPDNQRHRLVHVLAGTVTLNDLTLRDGLEDGATAGGGLRNEPGSTTTLNRVAVLNNSAGGNAGGILNRGTMTLNESTVRNNRTTDASLGGGGISNSPNAVLTLNDSRVLDNLAECANDAAPCAGGGIYNDADAVLTLDNSVVDGNTADGRQLFDISAVAGGIFADGTVTLIQSSVTNNLAVGESVSGGGITFRPASTGLIDRSVVAFNVADDTSMTFLSTGGGIASGIGTTATIQDSVISGNEAEVGGGLSGAYRVLRSTVANNRAIGEGSSSRGGGIRLNGPSEIVNTTFIGNTAEGGGGGISYNSPTGTTRVQSSTIAANASGGNGGGIEVVAGSFVMANTVLAGNSTGSSGLECSGTVVSEGHNLVQNLVNCAFVPATGDRANVAAGLAPVTNNGGPTAGSSLGIISGMQTRAPQSGSLLLDNGAATGCTDADGLPLPTDQIGRPRAVDGPDPDTTARCDIGAIEFVDAILADSFE